MTLNLSDLRWWLDNGGREALRSKGLEVAPSGEVRAIPDPDLGTYPQAERACEFPKNVAVAGRSKLSTALSTGYEQGVRV